MADLKPWEKYGAPPAAGAAGPWQKYAPDYLHPADTGQTPGAFGDNPMASDMPSSQDASPAAPGAPQEESGSLLSPYSLNTSTGKWEWGVPKILTGLKDSAVDAVTLPGDVITGKYPELGPGQDPKKLSPELMRRGINFATMAGGSEPLPRSLGAEAARLPAQGQAEALGIPLTKGQSTGALGQLTKEEAIRQGTGSASNIMRNFDATQREAIGGVTDTIAQGLGANAESMPDMIVQSIQDKVQFHKDQAASLYQIASDGGISIKPEMVDALPSVMAGTLEKEAIRVSPQLTPGADDALKMIAEDTAKMTGDLADAAKQPGAVAGSGGITLEGIEQMRRKLVLLGEGANPTDARAIKAIKRAFDDWTETAVDNMLVTGDDAALEALKQARASSAQYLKITSPHEGDVAGAAVQKMQKGDATAEEVANWLYGADVSSPTLNAPKVAQRVKGLVGANSPEWDAVRASAWNRIVKDQKSATGEPLSNAMMAKRIETFLNAKGVSLSHVLYSDAERAKMQDFADVLKATVTPRDATNPSRSGWTLTGAMNAVLRLFGAGVATATAGPQAGAAAYFAIPVFKNIGARKAALEATGATATTTQYPKTLGMAKASVHTPALGMMAAPVLNDVNQGLKFLGFGAGVGDGLSPSGASQKPPAGETMPLSQWMKFQYDSQGRLVT